ncbi:retrotransposon protein [Hordeum vulgare]|nr:retrotransposon protein [Hordeum vulgare]
MVAAILSEWGPTKILPSSAPFAELSATSITLHLLALFSGLLPPFSEFLDVVHAHYQIHALHLDPRSVLLVSSFAFLCEAFLGVPSLVALLQQFFSLQLPTPD